MHDPNESTEDGTCWLDAGDRALASLLQPEFCCYHQLYILNCHMVSWSESGMVDPPANPGIRNGAARLTLLLPGLGSSSHNACRGFVS